MTLRRRAFLAALPSLAPAARAAGSPSPVVPRLVVPLLAEPPGLIPGLSDAPATRLVGTKIYQGLLRIGPGAAILPGLASVEASDDQRRFTFRLRPGITWHDGAPCTAADAVFSIAHFHRTLSPRAKAALAGLEEARAVDPLTAAFRFAEPFAAFPYLADALSLPIVPQHVHDRGGDPPDPMPFRPVGTGPFRLLAFGRLVRSASFAGRLPMLEEITFPVLDNPARLAALQSGQPVLLVGDAVDRTTQLRQAGQGMVEGQFPPNLAGMAYLAVNAAAPPLDNQAVRQALSQAIDRAALLRESWAGLGRVATGPVASISRFAGDVLPPFDVRAASQALTTAGLRPDDGGVRARLALLHSFTPPWPRAAAQLATMLRQVGIELAPEPAADTTIAARIASGAFQLAAMQAEQRADPALDLGPGFADAQQAAASEQAMAAAMARIWLVEPAIPIVRDRRLAIPGGIYGHFADATLAG